MNRITDKRQLLFVAFVFFAAFIVLAARLLQYQVIDAKIIKEQSDKRVNRKIVLEAQRGSITDRNGNVLAYSLANSAVYFDKSKSQDVNKELQALFDVYPEIDVNLLKQEINDAEKDKVVIVKSLPRMYLRFVKRLGLRSIIVETTAKRVYPNNCLASHIIGFTNVDGVGLSGLEYTQEDNLRGIDGYIEAKTDERGRKLAHSESNVVEPVNGYTIVTTIDQTIQYYLENAIELGCQASRAKKVMALIQDAKTGDILGMASYPDFDPNHYKEPVHDIQREQIANLEEGKSAVDVMMQYWNNPVTQQLYEPGSTFKILIGMIGLEEGKTVNSSAYHCAGSKEVTGKTIKCWKTTGHGKQSLVEGFQNSCNVVFMNVVDAIGKKKLYEYLHAFKLDERSDIPLNGEAKPILTPLENLRPVDLARLGFGHNISLTPLQMMNVLSVVSNHGTLLQPRLIKEIKDENGTIVEAFPVRNAGRVISRKTADNILSILESVVKEGSGKNAYIPGYRIGGKTGTSIKIINGRYDDDRKVFSSFAAVAPIDDPRFNLIVIVDEPQSKNVHGSTVATPIAKEIMTNVLEYLEIEPDGAVEVQMSTVPNLIGVSFEEAKQIAEKSQISLVLSEDIEAEAVDDAAIVDKQYPLEGTLVIKGGKVYIKFEE